MFIAATYVWKRFVQLFHLWLNKLSSCSGSNGSSGVVSTGGAPTPAGTSVFTKHNWDMGMGYLWLNGWGIYHLMGGAFMAYWVGHL